MSIATAAEPVSAAGGHAGAIALSGISKAFPTADGATLAVLDNISLTVRAQSIVALLGASGCGKTTLLNIIAGLVSADRGTVSFDGVPSSAFNDWRRISYLFQDDRLLPWRTTLANTEFSLEAGDMPRAERTARARAMLQLVGLDGFADAFPHQLSGGMRSRAALARSLVGEPAMLLMDEPFSKLDAQTRAQMHAELLRIHALKQMTIVFVTHDVEEAVVLADAVVVLAPRPGRIREIVPIDCTRPRDPTSAAAIHAIQHLRSLI
jgi:ABC-type nitrate/sulfonate/bicarbonate transport system ATPase subunit